MTLPNPSIPASHHGNQSLWWLAQHGQSSGPYQQTEVMNWLATGKIEPSALACPVGGSNWRPIREWPPFQLSVDAGPGLEALPATQVMVDYAGGAPNSVTVGTGGNWSTNRLPGWAIIGGIVFVLLLVGLSLPRGGAVRPPSGPANPIPAVPQSHKAQRTYAYWLAMSRAAEPLSQLRSSDSKTASQLLRKVASDIVNMPTLDVDLDAVDCGLTWSRTMEEVANTIDSNGSPQIFVDAFVRGLQGDAFGVYNEQRAQGQRVAEMVAEATHKSDAVRAILTARYGVEFPR